MRNRFLLIDNPGAGRRSLRAVHSLVAALEAAGAGCRLHSAGQFGDSRAAAARAAKEGRVDCVIAAGGDGTIRQVASGLHGSDMPMGILPLGTANVLAREVGLPLKASSSAYAAILVGAPTVPVFPGRVRGEGIDEIFMCMASLGPDAETVANVSKPLKRLIGGCAYALRCLIEFTSRTPPTITVDAAGETLNGRWLIASRSRYYGGSFTPGFDVRAGDARLQTVILSPGPLAARLKDLIRFQFGGLQGYPRARWIDSPSVAITGPAGKKIQADGDIVALVPATLSVSEKPIQIVAPASP